MVFYRNIQSQKLILRTVALVWLILVVVETGCPVFCEDNSGVGSGASVSGLVNKDANVKAAISTATNDEDCPEDKSACACECLCHSYALQLSGVVRRAELTVYSSKISLTLSAIPSPPADGFYRPPRFA